MMVATAGSAARQSHGCYMQPEVHVAGSPNGPLTGLTAVSACPQSAVKSVQSSAPLSALGPIYVLNCVLNCAGGQRLIRYCWIEHQVR